MIMESYLAAGKKLLTDKELLSITNYVISVFGQMQLPDDAWLPLLRQDKKNKGNKILMALPKGIGKAVWDVPVSEKEIRDAMDYYRSCQT